MRELHQLHTTPNGTDLVKDLRAYAVEREIQLLGYPPGQIWHVPTGRLEEEFGRLLPDGRTVKEATGEQARGRIGEMEYIKAFYGVWERANRLEPLIPDFF